MRSQYTTILLPLLLCGSSAAVQAQAGYKPGYVVRPAGDTLRGYIQSRGALRNSQQCRFRSTAEAPVTEYSPADLRAYGITNGAIYESHLVPPAIATDAEPSQQNMTASPCFLETLVTGRASLYTRRDANDEVHYYLKMAAAPAGPVQELENRQVHRSIYTLDQDQRLPLYRKTLSTAFQDCLAIQPLLPKLSFSFSSLSDVVQRYNTYFDKPAVQPVAKSRRIRIAGGLVAGASSNEMRFNGNISLQKGTFKNNFTPTAGVFVSAVLSPLNDRFHLRLDMLFEQLKYSDSYVARGFSTVELREQVNMEWRSLRLPLQMRYHLNAGPVRPFLLAGVSFNLLMSSTRELRSEYIAGGVPVITNKPAVDDAYIRPYDVGLFAGVGAALPSIKGHALGLELRGERSSGYVYSSSFGAPIFWYLGLLSFDLF